MSAGREIQQQFCTLHTSLQSIYSYFYDLSHPVPKIQQLPGTSPFLDIIAIAYRTGVKISDFIWYNYFEPEVFAPLSFCLLKCCG